MAVSKRLRYEVLRRDNHACRYCGAAAPDVKMTVDHVVPSSLGGSDEAGNLVAACVDCNAGKSSTNPDAPLVEDVASDALRWSKALEYAAEGMLADFAKRDRSRGEFLDKWGQWKTSDGATVPLPAGWENSVDNFIAAGLPMPLLLECIGIAMGNQKLKVENIFRYVCGVAWNRVGEMQKAARGIASGDDCPSNSSTGTVDIYPLLDVVDDCVLTEIVRWLGGDEKAVKWASDYLWTAAAEGHKAFYAAVAAGKDPYEEAIDICKEAAVASSPFRALSEGVHDLGKCIHKADGTPCTSAAKFFIQMASCRLCAQSCKGHDGLCAAHLKVATSKGFRGADGTILGVLSSYKEIVDPWAVDA